MQITDLLPASELPDVRQRAEELFSREMLGAVLVGKFVGDYAAILATGLLGVHVGYPLGIVATIGAFVYWDRLQRRAQEEASKLSQAQARLDDYPREE